MWPDRNGVFAWQPGGAEGLDELQPREWRAPIQHISSLGLDQEALRSDPDSAWS